MLVISIIFGIFFILTPIIDILVMDLVKRIQVRIFGNYDKKMAHTYISAYIPYEGMNEYQIYNLWKVLRTCFKIWAASIAI